LKKENEHHQYHRKNKGSNVHTEDMSPKNKHLLEI
jgi:hypothetical protein